jgi:transposase
MEATCHRVVIAVDPHKHINAINVFNDRGEVLARETFVHDSEGFAALMAFARGWPTHRWAVEGSGGVGKNLAQRLVARGERVVDVPAKKSSLIRAFASSSGRKTDDIDAYSVGLAALRTPDLEEVTADSAATVLRLLAHRRKELVGLRTQALCRLHRELQIMVCGGAPRRLSVAHAKAMLAKIHPGDEVGKVRKQLAVDQFQDIIAIDKRLAAITAQITQTVKATPTTLQQIVGVGPVVTAIILGQVRDIARFKDRHHFASYTGAAPTTWGSAGDAQPAINLRGNRQLNHALHIAALSQIRVPGPGRDYYQRKLASGKTNKAARRCLKRRISDAVYRTLVADADRAAASPGGQMGTTNKPARPALPLPPALR